MVENGEEQVPSEFSLTLWKCFQMNVTMERWWLRCDTNDRRGWSHGMPDWQILLITQHARCSVWRRMALVVKEVSGWLKTSGRGSSEASTNSAPWAKTRWSSRRTWLWQSDVSSATASGLAPRRAAICRAVEGVFPGLEWLVRSRARRLQSDKPHFWLDMLH